MHRSAFLLCVPLLLAGCAGGTSVLTSRKNLVLYPPPPDTTRIQYLTSISASTDITGGRTGFLEMLEGAEEPVPVTKPYGIAVHDGRMYVVDAKIAGLEIFNLRNSSFETFTPSGKGALKKPINCTVDTDGTLYVADVERKDVVLFRPTGEYVSNICDLPDMKPVDVCVQHDKLLLLDLKSRQVRVYDKATRAFLYSFPDTAAGLPQAKLYSPTNLCASHDTVYVSDMGDFSVKVYTMDGAHLSTIGGYGSSHGQFVRPKGVAADRSGHLFVVDASFENVQMFASDGSLLMFFGGPYKNPGDMWLPAKVIVDYDNLEYFTQLVHDEFTLQYLIFVTNQYGPDKISVYGYVGEKK